MRFDRDKFFKGFRPYFKEVAGKALTPAQVANLTFLLDSFEASEWFSSDVRLIAYALATIHIETYLPKTNSRYAPITEGGSRAYFDRYDIDHNPRKARELGNLTAGDGYKYRGRGYCQITGKNNYTQFGIEDSPELALEPFMAFRIMEKGMRGGKFSGKKLGDYINAHGADYKGARRVINGQDRAAEIAGYARNIEHFLRDATSTVSADPPAADARESVTENVAAIQPPPSSDDTNSAASPPTQYQGIGLMGVLKRDLAAIGGGNLSFQGLNEYATQASGWPPWVIGIISKAAIIAFVVGVIWIGYRVIHYIIWKFDLAHQRQVGAATNQTQQNTTIVQAAK